MLHTAQQPTNWHVMLESRTPPPCLAGLRALLLQPQIASGICPAACVQLLVPHVTMAAQSCAQHRLTNQRAMSTICQSLLSKPRDKTTARHVNPCTHTALGTWASAQPGTWVKAHPEPITLGGHRAVPRHTLRAVHHCCCPPMSERLQSL